MSDKKRKESKKEIEILSGDGNNLDISPVYEHIKSDHIPGEDNNKKKDIVIPKGNSEKKK